MTAPSVPAPAGIGFGGGVGERIGLCGLGDVQDGPGVCVLLA
jgi:hypothetical protein